MLGVLLTTPFWFQCSTEVLEQVICKVVCRSSATDARASLTLVEDLQHSRQAASVPASTDDACSAQGSQL